MAGKNGGIRPGAGRKPKAKELTTIETIDKYMTPDKWAKELITLMKNSEGKLKLDCLKVYGEFRLSKPSTKAEHYFPEQIEGFDINILK